MIRKALIFCSIIVLGLQQSYALTLNFHANTVNGGLQGFTMTAYATYTGCNSNYGDSSLALTATGRAESDFATMSTSTINLSVSNASNTGTSSCQQLLIEMLTNAGVSNPSTIVTHEPSFLFLAQGAVMDTRWDNNSYSLFCGVFNSSGEWRWQCGALANQNVIGYRTGTGINFCASGDNSCDSTAEKINAAIDSVDWAYVIEVIEQTGISMSAGGGWKCYLGGCSN